MDCIIDIQGFINTDKKFIIKEATVLSISENLSGHWIVTPPIPFNDLSLSAQMFNDSQTKFQHGIEWFDGDIQARKLHSNLREIARKMSTIFVYGSENSKFIENLIARKVINLENIGCEPASIYDLSTTKTSCITHGVLLRKIYQCTLTNATFYKNWILKNREKLQEYHTPSSNLPGDTLSQALCSTFDSPIDFRILKDNEYYPTPSSNQRIACDSSGCVPC